MAGYNLDSTSYMMAFLYCKLVIKIFPILFQEFLSRIEVIVFVSLNFVSFMLLEIIHCFISVCEILI